MRHIKRVLIAIVLMSMPVNGFAESTESEGVFDYLNIEASGSFDVYSQYIWRGFALDTDPVFQPGFNLSGYGFTFSFWGSWDFDNNDALDGDEIDYIIDYTKEFDTLSVSAGHTYYEFPGTDTFSREFYAGVSLIYIPLSPSLTYYYDYGEEAQGGGDGQYIALEGSHSLDLHKETGMTLDLSGKVAYNDELFIEGEGGDAMICAGLTIPLTETLSFAPGVNYSVPLGDLDDSSDGNQRDRFYYGFSLGYSF